MTREEALNDIKAAKSNDSVMLALGVIAKSGNVTDITALMPIASSNKAGPVIKKLAVDAICSIIKESLLTKFNELNIEMRRKLAAILQTLDPKIINELSNDLLSNNNERRVNALQMLGILRRHPRVKDLAAKFLQDRDPKTKATAVSLLGRMMGPNDLQMIMALLKDPDNRVRANTVEALECLGNPRLVPALLRFRKEPNNRIRGNVLKALYNLGHTDIEEDLLEMLASKEMLQRASALWVISQVKFRTLKVEDAAAVCLLCNNDLVLRNALNALNALKTPRCLGYMRYLSPVFGRAEPCT